MKQLLVCLRMYSTGGYLQTIADFAEMHLSTVLRTVKRVSEAIASLYPQHVNFPNTEVEVKKYQKDFYDIASYPRVVGAVDYTHISIQSPGGNDANIYRNRNQYFSINVQAICNSNLKLINVAARWLGSVHDATIFRHCILLGVNGYFNNNYLIIPLHHCLST